MKLALILGTRPEIIKMGPLIKRCISEKIDFYVIHTGQHYSYEMDKKFFEDLDLPKPKYQLNVGSGNPGSQTAGIIVGVEDVILKERPSLVLVLGDTNTGLGGAIAARKQGVPIGHVEAGLRSFDNNMPEEMNRILIDHCSDLLFAPAEFSKKHLTAEGIDSSKIHVTGNTIVDAVLQNRLLARKKSGILREIGLTSKKYAILTLHRQENVDNKQRFENVVNALEKIDYPVIFPIHPRSKKMAESFGLLERLENIKNLKMLEPVGYLDFLSLLSNCSFIMTDSGGLQEEAIILSIPCITLRDNTERQETLETGANVLVGTDVKKILQESKEALKKNGKNFKNPYGDGHSSERIVEIIKNWP